MWEYSTTVSMYVSIPMILPKYCIIFQDHHNTIITVLAFVVWPMTAPNLILKIEAAVNPGPLSLLS